MGSHKMKRRPRLSVWMPQDFGEALNINWRIPDKFQWSSQTIPSLRLAVEEESLLMKQKVLEYPLLIELPWLKSTIEGKNIRVWSHKQWKDTQTTMGAHLIKRLVLHCGVLERHERARDFGEAKINWRIPEKFQWSPEMILATSSSQIGGVPSHEAAGPPIPIAHWTPQIYHWKKCHSLKHNTM